MTRVTGCGVGVRRDNKRGRATTAAVAMADNTNERMAFTLVGMFGGSINVKDNPEYYKAISPLYNIPPASERKLPPQFVMVGTKDRLITAAQQYVKALKDAGQPVEYWESEGRPHGFLDRGTNQNAGTSFVKDGVPAVEKMIAFLNNVFK